MVESQESLEALRRTEQETILPVYTPEFTVARLLDRNSWGIDRRIGSIGSILSYPIPEVLAVNPRRTWREVSIQERAVQFVSIPCHATNIVFPSIKRANTWALPFRSHSPTPIASDWGSFG